MLLFGFSGCGKTHLAKSLQKEFGMNFMYIKGPEILDKYIGGSEANIRRIFDEAEKNGPTIIFFDEFDSIVPMRNSSTASVTDRIVNQFLCYLDGVVPLKNTYVVAATTRPDLIDTAVIRPGRIDTHLFCDLPDKIDRLEFLDCFLKDKFLGFEFLEILECLALFSEGFSFADLDLFCRKIIDSEYISRNFVEVKIILEKLLGEIKPISKSKDFGKLRRVYDDFRKGRNSAIKEKQKQTLM